VFDEPEPMEEPMEEPVAEPMEEPMAEPMEEPMGEPEPVTQPTGLENEFKTVPGVEAPYQEESQEDDVLFGDAPEQRTKKATYN